MLAHIDADAFFASVLVRKHPRLRGKELLALGMGGGCVIAASYEAKAKGVRTGMRLTDALKLVPHAIRMPSDFRETALASQQIEAILLDVCPQIEQASIDEWYADLGSCVGGNPGNLSQWAQTVRSTILAKTGLSVSIGIASSKLLAKMAGEYRKPAGIAVIPSTPHPQPHPPCPSKIQGSGEPFFIARETFLKDRPAAAIPGIGRARSVHAQSCGWITAWDIAVANPDQLKQLFGKPGIDMQRELHGECLSPVTSIHAPPQSISRCRSFRATRDRTDLLAHVLRHLEYCVLKMRRQGLACRGISLWLRDNEYEHDGANRNLPQPMNTQEQIRPYVESCFRSIVDERTGYTQTGLALWQLVPSGERQFSLFEDPTRSIKDENMQKALDALHERYGRDAVTRGSALQVKSGTRKGFGLSEVFDPE